LFALLLIEEIGVERPGEHVVDEEVAVASGVGGGEVVGVDGEEVASRDHLTERLIDILQTVIHAPNRLMSMHNGWHYPSKLIKRQRLLLRSLRLDINPPVVMSRFLLLRGLIEQRDLHRLGVSAPGVHIEGQLSLVAVLQLLGLGPVEVHDLLAVHPQGVLVLPAIFDGDGLGGGVSLVCSST
jgi:hypothetical protein